MSTTPMPAAPAGAATPAAGRTPAGEEAAGREAAFATTLTSLLGTARAAAPSSRTRPNRDAAPVETHRTTTRGAPDLDAEPAADLVYHVHASVAADLVEAAPLEQTDGDRGTDAHAQGADPAAHGRNGGEWHGADSSQAPRYAAADALRHMTPAHERTRAASAIEAGGSGRAAEPARVGRAAELARVGRAAELAPFDGATDSLAAAPTAAPAAALRDPSLLQPEFRARLDRVVARLEALGHTVQVVETYRSQARQDHLFAQGRTTAGNVVTWTRHSQHTLGRAADLMIDGSFEPSAGYARLAQIAAEEGLRTLGARDPGHVELPGGRHHHPHTVMSGGSAAGQVAAVAPPARVAALAPLAAVAHTAPVAHIAHIAHIAHGARGTHDVPMPQAADASTGDAARGTSAERVEERVAEHVPEGGGTATQPHVPEGSGAGVRSNGIARAADAEIAGRVARVLQLQADAAAQPLTRVTLQLGEAGGDAGRIRVDLRGGVVDTAIELADPARAAELRGRIADLEAALRQNGLEAARLSVRSAAQATAALTAAHRPAGAEAATQPPALESLLLQHAARSSDRQPDGGRQGTDPEQRRHRGDQHRQEAK